MPGPSVAERDYIREKTLEGHETARAKGKTIDRETAASESGRQSSFEI
ncbi:hypothetical protein ACFUAG_32730 [Streptomyces sp. NPDC057193]